MDIDQTAPSGDLSPWVLKAKAEASDLDIDRFVRPSVVVRGKSCLAEQRISHLPTRFAHLRSGRVSGGPCGLWENCSIWEPWSSIAHVNLAPGRGLLTADHLLDSPASDEHLCDITVIACHDKFLEYNLERVLGLNHSHHLVLD